MTAALWAASVLIALAAGIAAQARWDVTCRLADQYAQAIGAVWFANPQQCSGCIKDHPRRRVRLMKLTDPAGYLCLRCAGNPPAPHESSIPGKEAR